MCACGANGEKLLASSGHKNRFTKRVPQKHFSITHVFGLIAFFKIRSLKFAGCFSHRISFFVLTYESHRTDPAIVLEPLFRMEERERLLGRQKYARVRRNIRRMKRILRHFIFQVMSFEKINSPLHVLTKGNSWRFIPVV